MLTGQRSFDDLGTPLRDVTFCVIDLETTGGSPATCAITEVGAVKLRAGECLGTLSTLVNPGVAIPREITYLTGITQAMVLPAPRIDAVLPALAEFMDGTIVVGHNVRFDLGFLQEAFRRHGWPRLDNRFVDTCGLARRLVRDDVPNCKLATLADRFCLPHRPTHRALDDALATGDLLHVLLERAASFGVLALDDLLALPTVQGHPQVAKLKLTASLPRAPGVYLFRDAGGRVLYVGKATDLRSRVRSYFSAGEGRRKVGQLLREVAGIDHVVCGSTLEAAVLEVRLIHEHQPRFNRQSKLWRRYAYLKLTLDERWPRLSVVRAVKPDDGCLYLGPLGSTAAARRVAEAVETALPIRRCSAKPPRTPRPSPCAPAQLGVSTCPCAGSITEEDYAAIVEQVVRGLTVEPSLVIGPLEERITALAAAQRYEEAADMRDRAAAVARAVTRQRRLDTLRQAGVLRVALPGGTEAVLDGGRLQQDGTLGLDPDPRAGPLPLHLADEVGCVAAWLEAEAGRVRVLSCEGAWCWPVERTGQRFLDVSAS